MGYTYKANAVFIAKQKNSLSTTPLQSKHPKKLHKQSLYTNINIYMGEVNEIIEAMREV
jgi:hypothetical protein